MHYKCQASDNGGIDIDAGRGGLAIDVTGTMSIDTAGGATNISDIAGAPLVT